MRGMGCAPAPLHRSSTLPETLERTDICYRVLASRLSDLRHTWFAELLVMSRSELRIPHSGAWLLGAGARRRVWLCAIPWWGSNGLRLCRRAGLQRTSIFRISGVSSVRGKQGKRERQEPTSRSALCLHCDLHGAPCNPDCEMTFIKPPFHTHKLACHPRKFMRTVTSISFRSCTDQ